MIIEDDYPKITDENRARMKKLYDEIIALRLKREGEPIRILSTRILIEKK